MKNISPSLLLPFSTFLHSSSPIPMIPAPPIAPPGSSLVIGAFSDPMDGVFKEPDAGVGQPSP